MYVTNGILLLISYECNNFADSAEKQTHLNFIFFREALKNKEFQ